MKQVTLGEKLDFYSFFTKYSLLDNYGFTAGLFTRLFRKLLPTLPPQNTFSFAIIQAQRAGQSTDAIVDQVQQYLLDERQQERAKSDLDRAIKALSAKLLSFGFDYQMQQYFERLSIETSGFEDLLAAMDVVQQPKTTEQNNYLQSLDDVIFAIRSLRNNKRLIGTSLHLTMVTQRLLNYAQQTKKLVELSANFQDQQRWKTLIEENVIFTKDQNSLIKYVKNHTDLIALEIVEHTSRKGENYVAEDAVAYKKFFKKGLLGGVLIALFAMVKLLIGKSFTGDYTLAFLYSVNYASCFIVVTAVGGTIATKQPAMTASTIIRYIDKNDEYKLGSAKDIILLLRRVSRSQFISLMGNFLMALAVASLLGFILAQFPDFNPIKPQKAAYLVNHAWPIQSGALLYAALAGVYLSLSGFISGYVDNKVTVARLPYRLVHHRMLSSLLPLTARHRLAKWVENKLGGATGNIALGFLLGCTFLLSSILPFKADIRHVAFSSANVGYGFQNMELAWSMIAMVLVSVLLIGLINFIVSFSLTFYIALKSRGVTTSWLLKILRLSLLDILKHPLDYIIVRSQPVEKPSI